MGTYLGLEKKRETGRREEDRRRKVSSKEKWREISWNTLIFERGTLSLGMVGGTTATGEGGRGKNEVEKGEKSE